MIFKHVGRAELAKPNVYHVVASINIPSTQIQDRRGD